MIAHLLTLDHVHDAFSVSNFFNFKRDNWCVYFMPLSFCSSVICIPNWFHQLYDYYIHSENHEQHFYTVDSKSVSDQREW